MRFLKTDRNKQDAKLVKAVLNGDDTAFRKILLSYQPKIFNFAKRFLGNPEEAKDIAQETFLKFFRYIDNFDGNKSLNALLFRIARNLCIDFVRKKSLESFHTNAEPVEHQTPLEILARQENSEKIMREIRKLPERQRTAIDLRYSEGFSYKEIAHIMGISVGSVESLLVRGRNSLRNHLFELHN